MDSRCIEVVKQLAAAVHSINLELIDTIKFFIIGVFYKVYVFRESILNILLNRKRM